ncbi:hypothetical protein CYLTODRAFT_398491 [Cylindrobasidium torrendii FP15055 ss-10]|uniref:C2H2-type domain-containing protein n=1 Tax=Cylindrobasidium torrendii FP15055 ss-10 TaxID=1314674 RepID=A0A0D7BAP0_9AGAR|nr:hypothetical protein CYLTODRAFT_398491 [Cylindrobasidium torrendii FP15055 ss-10]
MSAKRYKGATPDCKYMAKSPSDLRTHMNTHALSFACTWPGCVRTYPTAGNRTRHFRIHTKSKQFPCDWEGCEYVSPFKEHLKSHAKRHQRARPHVCVASLACQRMSYATLEELDQHRKAAHPQEEEDGGAEINAGEQTLPVPAPPVASTSQIESSLRATDAPAPIESTITSQEASSSTITVPTPAETTSANEAVSSIAAPTLEKPDTPTKPRRQRCSQLHCPYTTHNPARLAKHSTRHTAVLPFLCLEKGCLAAFATAKEEERHGRSVHKRPAEPKMVSKKRKRKRDDDAEDRGLAMTNGADESEIITVTPAPARKRRAIDGLLTPPAMEMPRAWKGKEREEASTKGMGKERAVSV